MPAPYDGKCTAAKRDYEVTSPMDDTHVMLIMSKFDEINRQMADDRREAGDSRRHMYERMDNMSRDVHDLKHKVNSTAETVNDLAPKVKRYADMEQQAQGAGRLGKLLWWVGGGLLAGAAYVYANVAAFKVWLVAVLR